jgi:hypothetical protein
MSAAIDIRNDRTFNELTDAILQRDQARTADLFFGMVKREGRSVGQALSVVTAAEAPFVQVPNHIMMRDGNITLVNNDHTILGLRASTAIMPYLPDEYKLLGLLQSVWYIPAGLDIWNQLLAKYPGRYATMKGLNVPPPDYGPVVWQQNQQPITEGSVEERLAEHMNATMSGDVKRSHALFLGLAADPTARARLKDQLLFLGLIDVQDTIIGRKARNTGHKAMRARAITDLADVTGWDAADGIYYMGVPDMAIGPLYYALYDQACVVMATEFPDAGKNLKQTNTGKLTDRQVEDFVRLIAEGTPDAVWAQITAHLKAGISIRSIGDAIQVGAAEIVLRTTVPRQFTDGMHVFEYSNTANHWMRGSDNPYQARILYLMAHFVNDAARCNKLTSSVFEEEIRTNTTNGKSGDALLKAQDEAVLAFDFAQVNALSHAYLQSGADVRKFMTNVAITACKFQDDPHNQELSQVGFQEYEHNTTHMKDRLLLAAVRIVAGWPKMPGERECYARYMSDWIKH